MERTTQFLQDTVRLIVDDPEAVSVERQIDNMGVLLILHVRQEDMGKVLGKQGQTAMAIRTLLRAIGAGDREAVHLRIHDPERDGEGREAQPAAY